MQVRIDRSKNKIEVKITEAVTVGKVYEANQTESILKDDENIVIDADLIAEKNAEIALLEKKLAWFEDKITTLSIIEWEDYNKIGS